MRYAKAPETTRATFQRLATTIDACRQELSALPEGRGLYEASRTLAAAAGQLRILHAATPDPEPRTRR